MAQSKGIGQRLVELEKKNPLMFKTYYPALAIEFSFVAVMLVFALAKLLMGDSEIVKLAIFCLEPMEIFVCCVVYPIILSVLHYKSCRKQGKYIFFKSMGMIAVPCLALSLLVGVNDILFTALFSGEGASFSLPMTGILMGATALVIFVLGMICQMLLIFRRARYE